MWLALLSLVGAWVFLEINLEPLIPAVSAPLEDTLRSKVTKLGTHFSLKNSSHPREDSTVLFFSWCSDNRAFPLILGFFSLARFFVFFQPSSQMVQLFTLATFYDHISFIAAVTFGINTVFFRLNCYLTVFHRSLNKFCPIFFLPLFKKLFTDSSTSILKCDVTDYFLCLSLLILLPHKRITRDFACLYCDIFPLCWNRSR